MRRYISKSLAWLKNIFISLLVLMLICVATLYFSLSSTKVSQFLFTKASDLVNELTLTYQSGNLKKGLQFSFQYKNDRVTVSADSVFVRANLGCFWRSTLCIEKITLSELIVSYYTSATSEERSPTVLPEVISPIAIGIDKLLIKKLKVNQNNVQVYSAGELESTLEMMGSTLLIDVLKLRDNYCQWMVEGDIRLRQNYPVDLHVECADNEYVAHSEADIKGDLTNVQFAGIAQLNTASLYIELAQDRVGIKLDGRIDILDPEFPMELNAQTISANELQLAGENLQVRQLAFKLQGAVLQPLVELNAEFENTRLPGPHRLHAKAQVLPSNLKFADVTYHWQEGVLHATGVLNYQQQLSWNGAAEWKNFSYTFGETSLEKFSGLLTFDGGYENDELRNHLDLSQSGVTVMGTALSAQGNAELINREIFINRLHVEESAQNFIDVTGAIRDSNLALKTSVQFKNLTRFVSQLSGSGQAQFSIEGPLAQPKILGEAKLQALSYEKYVVAGGKILVDWDSVADRKNKLNITLDELSFPGADKSDLAINWDGTIKDHTLIANLQSIESQQDKSLHIRCKGSVPQTTPQLTFSRWLGVCDRVDLSYLWQTPQKWQLDKSIEIDWLIDEHALSISTFCLQNTAQGSVCSNEFIHWRDGDIADVNVLGEKLPLVWLEMWTPQNLRVNGAWGFALSGSDLLTSPDLTVNITAADANAEWHAEKSETIRMVFTQLLASWHWQGKAHRIAWDARTVQSGHIEGHIELQNNTIDGEGVIGDLLLDRFAPLVMPNAKDKLSGRMNMGVSVSGTIENPVFNGDLSIREGLVETSQLPAPIEAVTISINIADNVATLNGKFTCQKQPGELGGRISWAVDRWDGDLTFAAEGLIFRPEPKIELHVSPRLALHFADNRIKLTGEINVPKARIEIRELPEQAISESNDAVVIGDNRDVRGQAIESEINIILGDDVWFKGFGLESDIEGSLLLTVKPAEPLRASGTLRLVDGRYKSYGQNLLVREGDLIFISNIENPQLRIEAVRDRTNDNVTVGLRAVGPASEPRISIFSDPDMSRQEQLSYLLTGSAPGKGEDLNASEAAAEAALSYALESELTGDLTRQAGKLFGVNDLRVTTISSDNGTQLGLSGYLTPNLMVSYGIGVFDAVNYLTLNYRLTKNIYLEMVSGESSAFDILWNFNVD